MPDSCMIELLYAFMYYLFLKLAFLEIEIETCWQALSRHLYMYLFYNLILLFWLVLVLNLVISTDQMLWVNLFLPHQILCNVLLSRWFSYTALCLSLGFS